MVEANQGALERVRRVFGSVAAAFRGGSLHYGLGIDRSAVFLAAGEARRARSAGRIAELPRAVRGIAVRRDAKPAAAIAGAYCGVSHVEFFV